MSKYFVQSPHTPEECHQVWDILETQGREILEKMYLGCNAGDHTAYGFFDANSEVEVRNMLLPILRDRARIVKVEKLTPAEVKAIH